jgi:hypothetical protein
MSSAGYQAEELPQGHGIWHSTRFVKDSDGSKKREMLGVRIQIDVSGASIPHAGSLMTPARF